jgi:hypothetical protein
MSRDSSCSHYRIALWYHDAVTAILYLRYGKEE